MSRRVFVPDLLSGEVALVTGGGSGIGQAIARQFAAHAADVVIAGRSAQRLDDAVSEIAAQTGRRCLACVCDVRDPESVSRLREEICAQYGPVTIVVNNAAVNFVMAAQKMTHRAFDSVVAADLYGTFNVTRCLIEDLAGAGGGVVLNIVVPEAERGFPGYAHCGAAKAAIVSLTRSWAREWGPAGVRVNAIGPGMVPTQLAGVNMPGLAEGTGRHDLSRVALGRLGTPEDIAAAALFLCSRGAGYITGVVVNVDGGLNIA